MCNGAPFPGGALFLCLMLPVQQVFFPFRSIQTLRAFQNAHLYTSSMAPPRLAATQKRTNMSNTLKRLLLAALVLAVAAGTYVWYVWNKPARDVQDETAMAATAQGIFDAYQTNEAAANQQYLNKAVAVSGTVNAIKQNQEGKTVVSLATSDPMFGIQCTMKEPVQLPPNSQVTIKGICTGFLMDVVLIDCYLEK